FRGRDATSSKGRKGDRRDEIGQVHLGSAAFRCWRHEIPAACGQTIHVTQQYSSAWDTDRQGLWTMPPSCTAESDRQTYPATEAENGAIDRVARSSSMQNATPVVFVVDDDVSVRESLKALIRFAGWQVEVFATAQEFLSYRRVAAPSCLVLDLALPDL